MNRLTKQEQIEYINGYLPANIHDIFATGGGIHIKPSHEGRFTEYKQRTGKTTEEALHSPDPHVRQMANFARNASHWKHQEGGSTGNMAPEELTGQGQPQPGGPEEMQTQEPQGEQQDPQQLIQAIQQELEQGAKPEEVIAELLQQQVDPQMIVQIFVQLGMPEQEVIQDIQSLMQQGAPEGQPMGDPNAQQQMAPQEQMQEQGQEEPQGPPMAYGGTPQFPYGGNFNIHTDYRAPYVIDNNNFNSKLLGVNSWADPVHSSLPFMSAVSNNPVTSFLGGIGGALAAGAGSFAGYKSLFRDNKKLEGYQNYFANKDAQAQNIKTPNFNGNPPASSPRANEDIYPNKQNDIWNQFQKKKDPWSTWKPGIQTPDVPVAQYNNNAPISGASTNRLNGAPSMTMQQYGGLARAQEGLAINNMQDITTEYNPDAVMIPTQGSYPASYQTSVKDVMPPMKVSRTDVNGNLLSPQELRANALDYRTQRNVIPEYNRLQRMFNWMKENNKSEKAWHKRNEKITEDNKEYIQQENVEGFDSKKNNNPPPCKGGKCTGLNREYGGELPHAQYGKDWSGQTGINNSPFGTNNFNMAAELPMMGPQDVYDPTHPISGASTNRLDNASMQKYQSKKNPNSVNTLNRTIRMSGPQIANNALNGLGMADSWLSNKEAEQDRIAANSRMAYEYGPGAMARNVYNSPNANGDYTVNSGKLKASMYVPPQDFGTSQYARYGGATSYANGGSTQYQQGGEYHVSHDELLQLMRNGAEVEFL